MQILSIVILIGVLFVVAVALYLRRSQSHGICANCGASSRFGYSNEPESKAEDIVKLCFTCLAAKLNEDSGISEPGGCKFIASELDKH
jgi:hypothetical protein